MRRNIVQSLQNAAQQKITEWTERITSAVQLKKQELGPYEEKKQQLIPILKQAHSQGVSLRELAKITGISHATIARWIEEAEEKEKKDHAQEAASEAPV